jgi:hypothetical protein
MEIDLHGHHPNDLDSVQKGDAETLLTKIVRQSWEMGESNLTFIHGHGRNRGLSPGFVNTNTGYFGLRIRYALRHDSCLRQWIKHSTLNCSDRGATSIKLKRNPNPSRKQLDQLPDRNTSSAARSA